MTRCLKQSWRMHNKTNNQAQALHSNNNSWHQTCNIELPLASARVQTQMSNKHNVVLYVDKELVQKTRELGFNLSKIFENHLKQLITQLSQINSVNQPELNGIHDVWCGRRGSNPGSQAWKSSPKEIDWHGFFTWLLKGHNSMSVETFSIIQRNIVCAC